MATIEPHKTINDYKIKHFMASDTLGYLFMMRNGLVSRKPQYERYQTIDMTEIDKCLEELYLVIERYGLKNIINMDETSILNLLMQNKVKAYIGVESIKISKSNFNEKESTMFIGSISKDPSLRIHLSIFAKGNTNTSEKKYGITDEKKN